MQFHGLLIFVNIDFNHQSNYFMTLLSSLSNLESLKVLSTLVFRDETMIELSSHNNRIKHVRLLTHICTQTEYFEIIGIRNEDFHKLIEFLFEKIEIDLIQLQCVDGFLSLQW
mgnify:FL=1